MLFTLGGSWDINRKLKIEQRANKWKSAVTVG